MKKTWKWITAGVLILALFLACIPGKAVMAEADTGAEEEVSAQTDEKNASLGEGTYQIFGRLWQATQEIPENWTEDGAAGASMGDGALNHEIKVTVKDGKAVLNLEFVRMTYTLFGESASGYLSHLNYFPGYTGTTQPEQETPVAAEIVSYWEKEDGTRIHDDFGTDYPRQLSIPLDEIGQQVVWVQVYVPIMESISEGMGTQYAKLVLDWSNPTPVKEDSAAQKNNTDKTLDPANLADGIYKLDGSMVKVDKTTPSMSNDAIVHKIKLTVQNGTYYVTMNFKGLKVGQKLGYLSELKYFQTGYTVDEYGKPQGDLSDVTVDSYQKYDDGSLVSDTYGSNYPDQVTFALIPEAVSDGYVPLQVFVPIMEAISAGTGTQPVFLKLDWSTLAATTADDADFKDTSSNSKASDTNGNASNNGKNASNTNGNTSNANSNSSGTNSSTSKSTGLSSLSNGLKRSSSTGSSLGSLGSSSLSGSSLKSSSLGSGLKSGLSGSSLKSGITGSGLKNGTTQTVSGVATGDAAASSSEAEKWTVIMIAAAFAVYMGVFARRREA